MFVDVFKTKTQWSEAKYLYTSPPPYLLFWWLNELMDWGFEKPQLTQQTIQNVMLNHSLTATKSSLCQDWNLSYLNFNLNWECSEVSLEWGKISKVLKMQRKANKLLLLVVVSTPVHSLNITTTFQYTTLISSISHLFLLVLEVS